jgi:hypothetical protein
MRLTFSVLKKLYIASLSQALAFLLISIAIPMSAANARYCPLAY